jgi:protein SCO1/2
MLSATRCLWILGLAVAFLVGCQNDPTVVADLSGETYPLVDQDSNQVAFPEAYAGQTLVVGTIYTHCPDICSMVTANMKRARAQLQDAEDVQFVTITFDPQRDTPSRLASYRRSFDVGNSSWAFLTGDPATINDLMDRLGIFHRVVGPNGTPASRDTLDTYFISHSDRILFVDTEGQVRPGMNGSRTPPDTLVEAIHNLRSWL